MRSLLDQMSLVEHENTVGLRHRRQPVRDHQRRAALHDLIERALHQGLAFGIERAGRFVKKQDRRIAKERTGNCDALALSGRERHTALP